MQGSLHPPSQEGHPWEMQQGSHPALTLYCEITFEKVHYSAFYSQVASLLKIIRAFTQHWLHFTPDTPLRKAETLRTEKSEKKPQNFCKSVFGGMELLLLCYLYIKLLTKSLRKNNQSYDAIYYF